MSAELFVDPYLYTKCFAYNRSEEESALAERTECQTVQRVTNVAQSGAIVRVAPSMRCALMLLWRKGRLLGNNGQPRSHTPECS